MNQVLEVIKKRSSIRGFTSEQLSNEEIELIAIAGLQAPTAKNLREIHISIADGRSKILEELNKENTRLGGIDGSKCCFFYNAPVVYFISAKEDADWGMLDAGIAVENMALAAESMGLGSLIIGNIKKVFEGERGEELSKKLLIPNDSTFMISIAVGHKGTIKFPHSINIEKDVSYIVDR